LVFGRFLCDCYHSFIPFIHKMVKMCSISTIPMWYN
jgi:hypothetical protein